MGKLICLKCNAQPGAQTAQDAKKLAKEHKMPEGGLVYLCGKCSGDETLYCFDGYGKNGIMEELALDGEVEIIKGGYYEYAKNSRPTHNALEHFAESI